MTKEKLEKAEILLKRIDYLTSQKEKWEIAMSFINIELSTTIEYSSKSKHIVDIDNNFINFEDIKALALARIQNQIFKLQKEFEAL